MTIRDRIWQYVQPASQPHVTTPAQDLHIRLLHLRDRLRGGGAPIGSVSSMEVNVDMLEQMDLMDISDQEALDVFLGSGGDEGVLASPLPGKVVHGNNNNDKVINQGRSLHYTDGCDGKFRVASTSSTNSQNTNEDGRDTQVVQSDDEDVHVDTVLLMRSPPGKDEEKNRSILSS
ncbi:dysbindin-like isoform X2 [Oncorhynchus clarkii lewisi]|uniref:dysbindin-like isoform X2 n=1 Tax=Oncorhynchus clarkii lewisi TaxID=490388 RepID=UPI0039B8A144